MKIRRPMMLGMAVLMLVTSTVACGGSERLDAADQGGAEGKIVFGEEESRIMAALQGRVDYEFSTVESLRGYRLVFDIGDGSGKDYLTLKTIGKYAYVRARVLKRNSQSENLPLTVDDFKGSLHTWIVEGGVTPEETIVVAALEKHPDGNWSIAWGVAEKAVNGVEYEAYGFGADVSASFPYSFNMPKEWFPPVCPDGC
jgi:hypothetical protein